jgi:hypothetical protein
MAAGTPAGPHSQRDGKQALLFWKKAAKNSCFPRVVTTPDQLHPTAKGFASLCRLYAAVMKFTSLLDVLGLSYALFNRGSHASHQIQAAPPPARENRRTAT